MERTRRTPALLASALLHGGLLALALIAVRNAPPLKVPSEPVSVSIVSRAPNVAPAVKAPEPSPPQAEESAPAMALPGPEAPEPKPAPAPTTPAPPPPKPAPKPEPAPPKPEPRPAPTPAPPKPAPTPTPAPPKPAPPQPKAQPLNLDKLAADLPKAAKPQPSLDLNKLTASIPQKTARPGAGSLNLDALADSLPAGRRAGVGARGPARAEQATQAREATGAATGLSGSELGALQAKLIRLWNPNCGVEGAGAVIVRVEMRLAPDGSLSAPPQIVSTAGDAPPAVVQAAALRAASAVRRGAPYDEISPANLRSMNNFIFKFDAKSACNR
jgi:outer membrane biosynthesis protein TonB